jgi:endoglucanase
MLRSILLLLAALLATFCSDRPAATAPAVEAEKPVVTALGPVAPDIVALTIAAGHVEHGRQEAYRQEKGDIVSRDEDGNFWIVRNGISVGSLISRDAKIMTFDRVVGERPDPSSLDRTGDYAIGSTDDPDYGPAVPPVAVYRKSKATDLGRLGASFDAPMEHTLYLKLPRKFKVGKHYTIRFSRLSIPEQTFLYDPMAVRSEAVHVSHIGFRPDDPSKVAFLSLWMGSGGPLPFRERTVFSVIENKSGRVVLKGEAKRTKGAGERNEDAYNRNINGADVHMIDFSALTKPGNYRVCVEGVGCSYPFDVQADVWRKAFYVSVRGLYHQRSGIEIGPPYTTFRRPRCFHPDDGVRVYASAATLMETANGIAEGVDTFSRLAQGRRAEVVPHAWGGYCDAGDWDRRIQHLAASRLLLELLELFPGYFQHFDLNIPGAKDLPDMLREALWGVDFFKRLQTKEGGVRGGIESEGHPRYGEASWQESRTVMAYAPDAWSTYQYVAAAARAAFVLQKANPGQSRPYLDSALSAMGWAEGELRKGGRLPHEVSDFRNLAAGELFRLTGRKEWQELFLATTVFKNPGIPLHTHQGHDQGEAAWIYSVTNRPAMDEGLKARCAAAIIKEADRRLRDQELAGFRWMKDPWRPAFAGAFTVPDCITVLRAHHLTGRKEYLRGAILASQTGLGANPVNMCYTTGLGWKSPQHPLHLDSRVTNQAPPPGITVLGPLDATALGPSDSVFHRIAGKFCYPEAKEWPVIETYWDVFWHPFMSEYTLHQTIGPNAYVWGYLAARGGA